MDEAQSPQACTSTQPVKQPRFCCRCRNHGLTIPFKGHRQNCTFKACPCDSCHLVTERRRIVAKQVALKRRLEGKAKKHAEKRPAAEAHNTAPDDRNEKEENGDGNNKPEPEETYSEELEQLQSSSPEDQPLIINCSPSTFTNPEEPPVSTIESPEIEMPASPTESPTMETSASPTESPTIEMPPSPTESPTLEMPPSPTESPTMEMPPSPTESPTLEMPASPTESPTMEMPPSPTESPTMEMPPSPTESPTLEMPASPTESPTMEMPPSPTESPIMEMPASPTESPAMEMHSSEYASESGVIRVGQVVFKPIQSEDVDDETFDSSYSSPIQTPSSESSPYSPISPDIDEKPFTQLTDFTCKDVAEQQSLTNLSYPSISKLSTPSAPSYSITPGSTPNAPSYCVTPGVISTPSAPSHNVTPGVISSSNTNLSRMYPYDNASIMASPARYSIASAPAILSSVPPFSPFAPGQSNTSMQPCGSTHSQMNVLMRIFPEHKPHFLQYVLESCGGDPIHCIETMWSMQEAAQDKKPSVIPGHTPDKPSNPPSPVASFQYIQPPPKPPPPYPTKISVASAPLSAVVTDHQQQQQHQAPAVVISSTAGPRPTYHLPVHFANAAVIHQNIPTGTNLTHPDTHNPNVYFGGPAGPFPDVMTLPKPASFDSFLSPVVTPQLAMHNISPAPGYCQLASVPTIQPSPHAAVSTMAPSPHGAVPMQAPSVHVKQEHCNYQIDSTPQQPLSIQSHLSPTTQTTQMYCQTIGRIQPGKCLSYTSLQAVASANPSNNKPILLPLMTQGAVGSSNGNKPILLPLMTQGAVGSSSTSKPILIPGGEHLSESNGAFSKWLDSYKTMLTNACTTDEMQSPQQCSSYYPQTSIPQLGAVQCNPLNPDPTMTPQLGAGLGALPAHSAGLGMSALTSHHRTVQCTLPSPVLTMTPQLGAGLGALPAHSAGLGMSALTSHHRTVQCTLPSSVLTMTPQLGALPAHPLGLGTLTSQHRTDAVAAQVLMSLGASPARKQQDQASLKDLLIEEE